MSITGGCACGAIAYEIRGHLLHARSCHCSKCRKVFSGAGSTMAFCAPETFKWTKGEDTLSEYSFHKGWSVLFCSNCGTSLAGMLEGEVRGIALGTADGDPGIQISEHIFVGSKAPWDHIGGDAPQFEKHPE